MLQPLDLLLAPGVKLLDFGSGLPGLLFGTGSLLHLVDQRGKLLGYQRLFFLKLCYLLLEPLERSLTLDLLRVGLIHRRAQAADRLLQLPSFAAHRLAPILHPLDLLVHPVHLHGKVRQFAAPRDDACGPVGRAEPHPPVPFKHLAVQRDEPCPCGGQPGRRRRVPKRRHDERSPKQPPHGRSQPRLELHPVDDPPQHLRVHAGVQIMAIRLDVIHAEDLNGAPVVEQQAQFSRVSLDLIEAHCDQMLIGPRQRRLHNPGVIDVGLDKIAQHPADGLQAAGASGFKGAPGARADTFEPTKHLAQGLDAPGRGAALLAGGCQFHLQLLVALGQFPVGEFGLVEFGPHPVEGLPLVSQLSPALAALGGELFQLPGNPLCSVRDGRLAAVEMLTADAGGVDVIVQLGCPPQ